MDTPRDPQWPPDPSPSSPQAAPEPRRIPEPRGGFGSTPGIPPARPGAVTAAFVLWVVLGVVLVLGGVGAPATMGAALGVLLGVFLLIGLGVFVIALGLRVKRGDRGARVTVSVIGVFISLFLWPVVFTVSAIVLQFLPSSNAWFESRQLP